MVGSNWRVRKDKLVLIVDAAAAKVELVVEEEEAGGFAGSDGECSEGVIFFMELQHFAEIDSAEHVDVVQDERL